MKIYILNVDNLVSYNLPKKVEGSYQLNNIVNNKKEDLIEIRAEENKWYAYSNNIVKIIVNDNQVEKIELKYYSFYQLLLYGTQKIYIYTLPSYDNTYVNKMVSEGTKIILGSKSSTDILVSVFNEKQIELEYKNNRWHYTNLNTTLPIYVNSTKKNSCYINSFDIIFAYGVKIILVGPYLFISNPNNCILNFSSSLSDSKFEYILRDYNTNGKQYKDFYSDEEYFVKSPIFQNKIKKNSFTISDPPTIAKSKGSSVIMQIVPTIAMSVSSLLSFYYTRRRYTIGEVDNEAYITSIVVCGVMLFTGILWPFIQNWYQKLIDFITIGSYKHSYKKYLKQKQKDINDERLKTKGTLKDIYIDLEECSKSIMKRNPHLFSVSIDNERFLEIRLGIGNIKFDVDINYTKPEYSVVPNGLYNDVDKMLEKIKYIEDVPVTISLKKENILAFINEDNSYKYTYIKYLLLQLVTLHSFSDLKIVILTDQFHINEYNYIKNLGHLWDNEYTTRFLAYDLDSARIISSYLETIFIARSKEDSQKKIEDNSPYYLILCDSIKNYRDLNIIKDIIDSDINYGFSLVIFDELLRNIPSKCDYFVNYNLKNGSAFKSDMDDVFIKKFDCEYNEQNNLVDFDINFLELSNIPIKIENNFGKDLTTKLGFLEMYGVGKVELLNSENRWKTNDIVNSLSVPVGVDANGDIVNLDLHEKRHGPHGLVAGMTGSGKSEFIVTYILSLAINYNPEEVQFVLIDYKGGGLAGAFENRKLGIKLPHLVGTITNLDKSEIDRTLASIQSELKRRQKVFNEVKEKLNTGTIDIYKYQKLYRENKIDKPMSHLFIISDEFAELKAQQPEFMDQLVSAARIGRSLGIHLILATQKPSGVVDDQIWSNSKFKICCKVQTVEDSSEMLGKPDAAYLKDSGRFYLQVGYDIYYIMGQSAYSGTKYIPSDKIISNIDDNLNMINSIGEHIFVTKKEDKEEKQEILDMGEELTNILKYLIDTSKKMNYHIEQIWLDNIPNYIYLENVKVKYNSDNNIEKNIINPIIGEYDDPENQQQGPVHLPITKNGNCLIFGATGSGKTTFLATFILSTIISHTTNEVKFYIIDYANEFLKMFEKAPQVGNVLTMDNADKVMILLKRIMNEIKIRKKILTKYGMDYLSYVNSDNPPMPNYIVVINGLDSFKDQFDDFISYSFLSIIRECNKYGITFVVTAVSTGVLSSVQQDQFNQIIALKQNDPMEYMSLFNTRMIPASNPGRGLIVIDKSVYQFQTALIANKENIDFVVSSICKKLSTLTYKADGVPVMPDVVSSELFVGKKYDLSSVPIGYNTDTIEPSLYDFNRSLNLIIGKKMKGIFSFVNAITKLICEISNVKILILDGSKALKNIKDDRIKYYDSGFSKVITFLQDGAKKHKDSSKTIIIFISGYEKIEEHLKDYYKEKEMELGYTLNDFIDDSLKTELYKFVICGKYSSAVNFENEKWFSKLSKKDGIVIFPEFNDQDFITAKRLDDEYNLNLDESNAFIVRNNQKEVITYLSDE